MEKVIKGQMLKSASLEVNQVDDADLKKINKFTLSPLKADEVFTFKIMAGDNHDDDRNFEPFSGKAIKDMAKLYPGKPMIWDHGHGAKGTEQVARIYDAEAVETGKKLKDGRDEIQLVLKAYMPILESNKDLISEIQAGIKKEVSTRCRPEKLICSVCGQDQMEKYCHHWSGHSYEGKRCLMVIDGVKEAHELSFVGIPAQPRAGTLKAYNPDVEPMEYKAEEPEKIEDVKEVPDFDLIEAELFLIRERAKSS